MKECVLREIFGGKELNISELMEKSNKSADTCYKEIRELQELGIVNYEKGKITLLKNPVSSALKQLFFSGFDVGILKGNYLKALVFCIEPRTVNEISSFLKISQPQTYRILKRLSQFLSKKKDKYAVSEKFSELKAFLKAVDNTLNERAVWSNGNIKLLRIPKNMPFDGTLTGFSVFERFGIELNTDANYVVQPEQKLTPEQVLVHALRFSEDSRDILFCILFYLKNKKDLQITKLEKEVKEFKVLDLWVDIISWLNGLPVKNENLFPSPKEFKEKASLYNVELSKKFEEKKSIELFREIERHLSKPVNLYLIGGNALMEHGIKTATKDIDAVVIKEQSAKELTKALTKTGFKTVKPRELQYQKLGSALMFEKKGMPRIDLFEKKACDCLNFSKRMQERSSEVKSGKLKLFKAGLEDVFLLKSVSSRDSDLVDCIAILSKKALNWNTIMKEIKTQKKNLKQIQELIIIEHFEAIEETLNTEIPIKNKVENQALERAIQFLCKKPCSVKEIKSRVSFPEYRIRNTLKRMVKKNKMKKIKGKPLRFAVK